MPNYYKGKIYTLPEEKIKIGRPLDATFRITEDSADNYASHLFEAFDQAIKRMENGEDVEPECIKKARTEVEEYWNSQVKKT